MSVDASQSLAGFLEILGTGNRACSLAFPKTVLLDSQRERRLNLRYKISMNPHMPEEVYARVHDSGQASIGTAKKSPWACGAWFQNENASILDEIEGRRRLSSTDSGYASLDTTPRRRKLAYQTHESTPFTEHWGDEYHIQVAQSQLQDDYSSRSLQTHLSSSGLREEVDTLFEASTPGDMVVEEAIAHGPELLHDNANLKIDTRTSNQVSHIYL